MKKQINPQRKKVEKYRELDISELRKDARYYGYNLSKNFMTIIDAQKNEYFVIKKDDDFQKSIDNKYDPQSIDTLILIYEDQVKTWFLDIAKELEKNNEAGFVILMIAISYIEGNQQFRNGKTSNKNSKDFFIKGMQRIFGGKGFSKEKFEFFYNETRCGLFHDGMTRGGVKISGDFGDSLKIRLNKIVDKKYVNIEINPHLFLSEVMGDFGAYIKKLKTPGQKLFRGRFKKMYYSMYFGKHLNEDPNI